MSGLMHKVKDALSGDKSTENTGANQGGNGENILLTSFFDFCSFISQNMVMALARTAQQLVAPQALASAVATILALV